VRQSCTVRSSKRDCTTLRQRGQVLLAKSPIFHGRRVCGLSIVVMASLLKKLQGTAVR
jgi:hypothetical protein